MKKYLFIAILIISLPTFGQKKDPLAKDRNSIYNTCGMNISVGNVSTMGVNYKNWEIQGMRHMSTLAKYPAVIVNANYHAGIIYVGYGSEGISAGVQFQKKQYMLRAGAAGEWAYVTVGVNSFAKQQSKLLTKNDQLLILTNFASGYLRGWHEAISASHWGSGQFWDNKISWKNKYKNGDPAQGDKFPMSSTLFVSVTDGYHLTNLFTHVADLATLTVALKSKDGWKWKTVAKKVLLSAAANSLAFYISYDKIYR